MTPLRFFNYIKTMKKLFLDDMRQVKDACYYMPNAKLYWEEGWDTVRNFGEFVDYITKNGLPDIISFDHDLADFHYEFKPEDYDNMSEDEMNMKFGSMEKTGMDCAKWLVEYCLDKGVRIPEYHVHSANPQGKENIIFYLENAKKHIL